MAGKSVAVASSTMPTMTGGMRRPRASDGRRRPRTRTTYPISDRGPARKPSGNLAAHVRVDDCDAIRDRVGARLPKDTLRRIEKRLGTKPLLSPTRLWIDCTMVCGKSRGHSR